MRTPLSQSTLIDIGSRNVNRERKNCLQTLRKIIYVILCNMTKKHPNLLTPDPNICYNELAMVRVEIFGLRAVLIAPTVSTAFYFSLKLSKATPPFYNILSYIILQYVVFVKYFNAIYCVFSHQPTRILVSHGQNNSSQAIHLCAIFR